MNNAFEEAARRIKDEKETSFSPRIWLATNGHADSVHDVAKGLLHEGTWADAIESSNSVAERFYNDNVAHKAPLERYIFGLYFIANFIARIESQITCLNPTPSADLEQTSAA